MHSINIESHATSHQFEFPGNSNVADVSIVIRRRKGISVQQRGQLFDSGSEAQRNGLQRATITLRRFPTARGAVIIRMHLWKWKESKGSSIGKRVKWFLGQHGTLILNSQLSKALEAGTSNTHSTSWLHCIGSSSEFHYTSKVTYLEPLRPH